MLNGQFADQLSAETTFYVSNQTPLRKVFITQQVTDHLFPGLTAKQALVYASKFKNATEKVKIDHEATALKLLSEMAMPEAANRRVEHLSGGQQRRLILACELTSLKMPNLILADEAVSGLDTDSAEKVRHLSHFLQLFKLLSSFRYFLFSKLLLKITTLLSACQFISQVYVSSPFSTIYSSYQLEEFASILENLQMLKSIFNRQTLQRENIPLKQ